MIPVHEDSENKIVAAQMPLIIFQNLLGLVFQVFSLTRRVVLGSAFVEPGQFYRRLSPS